MITSYDKLFYYLRILTNQIPIESKFIDRLADHLNAEIVLGTVGNMKDAIVWLSYTYLFIRMLKNPLAYGITFLEKERDRLLHGKRVELITSAANRLDKCKMIRFEERTGQFSVTELGRIASHFYIQNETIYHFNEKIHRELSDAQLFNVVAQSAEFSNIILREDEQQELKNCESGDFCPLSVKGSDNQHGKVNILLQSYISQVQFDSFSLISDMSYISQNAGRIFRALFEISRSQAWVSLSHKLLNIAKMIDKRMWSNEHPLKQFDNLKPQIIEKLQDKRLTMDRIRDSSPADIGGLLRANPAAGVALKKAAEMFPRLNIEPTMSPITRTVIRITLTITCDFTWNDKWHGTAEPFWIWVEDENQDLVHSEYFVLHKKQKDEENKLTFIIPIHCDPFPEAYYVVATSDRWLNSESQFPLNFR